jgi:N,N'-diacetyllegionaminate synthase
MVTIIAEAGVNHNGSLDLAKSLVDIASESGADFVKFQTFRTEQVVTQNAEKAPYQKSSTGESESQFAMIKKLELSRAAHVELISYCEQKNIAFLSTPFDHDSIELLAELEVPLYKIPSGEITNLPYLRHVGKMGKPIIMSTGMATLFEVRKAVHVLEEAGVDKDDLTILHCNTEYPTPMRDVNLRAMLTIQDDLDVRVGYSDHTVGIAIPIAAVAMGATVIEKHFTTDRTLPGPDHAASLEPNELRAMVECIRNIEIAMGDGIKEPSASELKNIPVARKSIVAKTLIARGEQYSERNLAVKRPGTGISPIEWDTYIGKFADKEYQPDDLIK